MIAELDEKHVDHGGSDGTHKSRALVAALLGLLVVQLVVSLFVLARWEQKDWYPVTGDEPHYLVIAQAIERYRTFEVTQSYRDEFRDRRIYPGGLAAAGATPDHSNTHANAGAHGLFSVHNVGLPLALVVPYAIAGVRGAKAALVLTGLLGTVCCWIIAGVYTQRLRSRVLATATATFAMPLLFFASQVYPDLLAGLLGLVAITALLTRRTEGLVPGGRVAAALAVAFLPWLQIKFVGLALVLVVALCVADRSASWARRLTVPGASLLSFVLLATYNQYAFGRALGPYGGEAVQASRQAVMVFDGLLLDRAQGMLFQNPALIIGLLFLPRLIRRDALVGITSLTAALVVLIPNAMHPNWYGGFSFAGRFGWTASVMLMAPAVYGLTEIASAMPRLFTVVSAALLSLQAIFVERAIRTRFDFYSVDHKHPQFHWEAGYRSLYGRRVDDFLPALYDRSWALRWAPNVIAGVALVGLVIVAWRASRGPVARLIRHGAIVGAATVAVLVLTAAVGPAAPQDPIRVPANLLESNTGVVRGAVRIARAGIDDPGWLAFGPYTSLAPGSYRVTLRYRSDARASEQGGMWEIGNGSRLLANGILRGSNGKDTVLRCSLRPTRDEQRVEVRVLFDGSADLRVERLDFEAKNDRALPAC